jgi:hypothetical protein
VPICVVLSPKKSSTYSGEYASGFSGPAASHLAAPPSPRHEGNVGQAPRDQSVLPSDFDAVISIDDRALHHPEPNTKERCWVEGASWRTWVGGVRKETLKLRGLPSKRKTRKVSQSHPSSVSRGSWPVDLPGWLSGRSLWRFSALGKVVNTAIKESRVS